jgi:hypothetical protein
MLDLMIAFLVGFFLGIGAIRIFLSHVFILRIIDKKAEYAKFLITNQVAEQDRDRMQGFILGLGWCEEQFVGKI